MTRVLLIDDHPIVLSGLTALVASDPDLVFVGSAGSVAEAMTLPEELAPDIAIVDVQLPDGDGIFLGAALKRRWPQMRVVMLTMSADPASVMRSLGTGLDGFLLKDSDPEDILAAIHSAAGGSLVVSRGASAPIVSAAAAVPHANPLDVLDARDREILDLLARGLPTSHIAAQLFLAPKTIRNRISEMLGKLGVASREDAIVLARRHGPISGSR